MRVWSISSQKACCSLNVHQLQLLYFRLHQPNATSAKRCVGFGGKGSTKKEEQKGTQSTPKGRIRAVRHGRNNLGPILGLGLARSWANFPLLQHLTNLSLVTNASRRTLDNKQQRENKACPEGILDSVREIVSVITSHATSALRPQSSQRAM